MTKKKSSQPAGPKYKYKRIYDLGADKVAIIDQSLTEGKSTMTIADRILNEWSDCSGTKIGTLDRQLSRYRRDIVEPRLVYAAEKAIDAGTAVSEGMRKFRKQVDVMDRLNAAINMQWERIERAYAIEDLQRGKGKDKLNVDVQRELRPFTDMCKALATLQLETGVVRRVPKQVQGIFQQLGRQEMDDFRVEMSTNDDTLLAMAKLKEIVQEAAGETLDGEYIPVASQLEAISELDADFVESGAFGADSIGSSNPASG